MPWSGVQAPAGFRVPGLVAKEVTSLASHRVREIDHTFPLPAG